MTDEVAGVYGATPADGSGLDNTKATPVTAQEFANARRNFDAAVAYLRSQVHGAMMEREAEYLADYAPAPPGATRFDIPEEDGMEEPDDVVVVSHRPLESIEFVVSVSKEGANSDAGAGYPRQENEEVSLAQWDGNSGSLEAAMPEAELRTPIAWTLGADEWCYGSVDPGERDWEPIYYADELPKREERYSGAAVAWLVMIALLAGSLFGQFALATWLGR